MKKRHILGKRSINVEVDKEVYARIIAAARADNRSLASWARAVMQRELERAGVTSGLTGIEQRLIHEQSLGDEDSPDTIP